MTDTSASINTAVLQQLGEVKGQLSGIAQLIQSNHAATQTRIEDLDKSITKRMDGLEKRVGVLEKNERGTAILAGSLGALSGTIVTAALAAIKSGFVR